MSFSGGEGPKPVAGPKLTGIPDQGSTDLPNLKTIEIPTDSGGKEEYLVMLVPSEEEIGADYELTERVQRETKGTLDYAITVTYNGKSHDVFGEYALKEKLGDRLDALENESKGSFDLNQLRIRSPEEADDDVIRKMANYLFEIDCENAAKEPTRTLTPGEVAQWQASKRKLLGGTEEVTTVQYSRFGNFERIKGFLKNLLGTSGVEKPEEEVAQVGRKTVVESVQAVGGNLPGTVRSVSFSYEDPFSSEVAAAVTVDVGDKVGEAFAEKQGLLYVGKHGGRRVYAIAQSEDSVRKFIDDPLSEVDYSRVRAEKPEDVKLPGTVRLENFHDSDPLSTNGAAAFTVDPKDERGIIFLESQEFLRVGTHQGRLVYAMAGTEENVQRFIEHPEEIQYPEE